MCGDNIFLLYGLMMGLKLKKVQRLPKYLFP